MSIVIRCSTPLYSNAQNKEAACCSMHLFVIFFIVVGKAHQYHCGQERFTTLCTILQSRSHTRQLLLLIQRFLPPQPISTSSSAINDSWWGGFESYWTAAIFRIKRMNTMSILLKGTVTIENRVVCSGHVKGLNVRPARNRLKNWLIVLNVSPDRPDNVFGEF